eukprot:m51a1_g14227 putative glycoside hydrolase family 18 protein (455) ;mRNA; f:200212-201908
MNSVLVVYALVALACVTVAQNCGTDPSSTPCPDIYPCCSIYGWCGNAAPHCTTMCKCGCPGKPACNGGQVSSSKKDVASSSKPVVVSSSKKDVPTSSSAGNTPCGSVDLTRRDNMVLYWGQNGNEGPLRNFCADSTFDILILSFMHVFPNGESKDGVQYPLINLAGHCETIFPDMQQLLTCPDVAQDIKYCQSRGKAVLMSMGGAAGAYSLGSQQIAEAFAQTFWDMFLGGGSSHRPFGSAVLDGVDLDIEGGGSANYAAFVNRLRAISASNPGSRRLIVGAAPQCPFPDAYVGPDGAWTGTALSNSVIDFVSAQFYNNAPCNLGTSGFRSGEYSFQRWNDWAHSQSHHVAVFVGSPASASSTYSGGYISDDALKGELGWARGYSNFGGLMMWSAAGNVETKRGEKIAPWLKSFDPRPACASHTKRLSAEGATGEVTTLVPTVSALVVAFLHLY